MFWQVVDRAIFWGWFWYFQRHRSSIPNCFSSISVGYWSWCSGIQYSMFIGEWIQKSSFHPPSCLGKMRFHLRGCTIKLESVGHRKPTPREASPLVAIVTDWTWFNACQWQGPHPKLLPNHARLADLSSGKKAIPAPASRDCSWERLKSIQRAARIGIDNLVHRFWCFAGIWGITFLGVLNHDGDCDRPWAWIVGTGASVILFAWRKAKRHACTKDEEWKFFHNCRIRIFWV